MAKVDTTNENVVHGGNGAIQENGQGNGQQNGQANRPWVKRILLAIVTLGIIVGLFVGVRYVVFMRSHAVTDDAYLTSNIIQISPQVSGTVKNVYVKDNQLVKAGDLLVTLDDSTFRADVANQSANLAVAQAQAQGAGVSVNLTQQTGSAQITQAQGALGQAQSGVGSAKAAVEQAAAGVNSAVANQKRAIAAVKAAQAAVTTAKANVAAAEASVTSAEATYTNAAREAHRFTSLAAQGAEAQERADTANTAAASAKAALDSSRQQVAAAQAVVNAREADLAAAQEQVRVSNAAVQQSKAQLTAAKQGVGQAIAKQQQAVGALTQAQTAPTQTAVSQSGHAQALAKVQQAQAALQTAQLHLSYTKIYAPVAGKVSQKSVEVGELVQTGTPLMSLIPPKDIWVVANYKETQMPGIKRGNPAEVRVDAIPGRVFTGHVDSIAAGTGSTFALLPPENASGNFVKVVQRVPVKIVLDHGQPDMNRLRTGMSVTAIISTK